jgi:hypothetical protein
MEGGQIGIAVGQALLQIGWINLQKSGQMLQQIKSIQHEELEGKLCLRGDLVLTGDFGTQD